MKFIPLILAPVVAFFVPLFFVSAMKALRDKQDQSARQYAYLTGGAFALLILLLAVALIFLLS